MLLEHYYYYFRSALSKKICEEILEYGKKHVMDEAVIHVDNPGGEDDFKANLGQMTDDEKTHVLKKRKSNITWLDDPWIYKEVHPYIHEANRLAGWNFDWDFSEECQFTKYGVGQYYGWHADAHHKPYSNKKKYNYYGKVRKLSVTIQLNKPEEFDGGNLEFSFRNGRDYDKNPGKAIYTCTEIRPQGSIVVFPSFVWHRVTPVTRGTRYSLVLWNLGLPWR